MLFHLRGATLHQDPPCTTLSFARLVDAAEQVTVDAGWARRYRAYEDGMMTYAGPCQGRGLEHPLEGAFQISCHFNQEYP